MENGIRSLTGVPVISYETSQLKTEDKVFDLLKAADSANYIMTANTFKRPSYGSSNCGFYNSLAFSLMAVFNITDEKNKNYGCLLVRDFSGSRFN